MNSSIEWSDLKLILAIAETGTLSGAGRRLGMSHATVYRRLGQIEDRIEVRLFRRSKTGYSVTAAGEDLASTAGRIEAQVLDAERRIAGQDIRPSGTVRVTTLDSFLVGFLTPVFKRFQKQCPEISLEVIVSNHLLSLTKREAEIAIRPSSAPSSALVGRKIATIAFAVYGRPEIVSVDPDDHMQWIGPDETMIYPELEAWMAGEGVNERCSFRTNSVVGMHAAIAEGLGLGVLPCYLGDADSRLERSGPKIPELETDLMLLTHPDLRKTARIRAVLDFVADATKALRPKLAGAGNHA